MIIHGTPFLGLIGRLTVVAASHGSSRYSCGYEAVLSSQLLEGPGNSSYSSLGMIRNYYDFI